MLPLINFDMKITIIVFLTLFFADDTLSVKLFLENTIKQMFMSGGPFNVFSVKTSIILLWNIEIIYCHYMNNQSIVV